MYQDKYIFLVVAPSGSGKDTVVNKLCDDYGFTKVKSYTTRKPRQDDKNDIRNHTFVSMAEYQDIVDTQTVMATTYFNKNYYCATQDQVDDSDFYIVDVEGVKTFKQNYKGNKKVKVFGIECMTYDRYDRMLKRGDSDEKAKQRMANDSLAFRNWKDYIDICFLNDEGRLEDCCKAMKEHIDYLIKYKSEE